MDKTMSTILIGAIATVLALYILSKIGMLE